jgi:hypothetical protein
VVGPGAASEWPTAQEDDDCRVQSREENTEEPTNTPAQAPEASAVAVLVVDVAAMMTAMTAMVVAMVVNARSVVDSFLPHACSGGSGRDSRSSSRAAVVVTTVIVTTVVSTSVVGSFGFSLLLTCSGCGSCGGVAMITASVVGSFRTPFRTGSSSGRSGGVCSCGSYILPGAVPTAMMSSASSHHCCTYSSDGK